MILSGMTMSPTRNLKVVFVGPASVSGKAFLTKMETIASLKSSTSQAYVERCRKGVTQREARDHEKLPFLLTTYAGPRAGA